MQDRFLDHPLPDDETPLVPRPICVGEPSESISVVRIVEPDRAHALRTLVLSMVSASDARNLRNTVRDLDRPGTLAPDLADRDAIALYIRDLLADGSLVETPKGIVVPKAAPPAGRPDADPLAAVSGSMAGAPVEAVMSTALFLLEIVEALATRTHRDAQGCWISLTTAALPAAGVLTGRVPDAVPIRRWYRVDEHGALHVPADAVLEPVETGIVEAAMSSDRWGRRDPFAFPAVEAILSSPGFVASLKKVHPPTRRRKRGDPIDARIVDLLRSVCVFASKTNEVLPDHLRHAAIVAARDSDAFPKVPAPGSRSETTVQRHGGYRDAYHWLTPPDPTAAERRLQAFRIGLHSLGTLIRATARVDAGDSVIDILADGSRSPLSARRLGRVLATFPYPPAADRDEDRMPDRTNGRRRSPAQAWREDVLGDVCDLCAAAGGTEILRHGERQVRRLAAWMPTAMRTRFRIGTSAADPKGPDRYLNLGRNFLRSAVRDPDGACDLIERGAFDFVSDLRARLAELAELVAHRNARSDPRWRSGIRADGATLVPIDRLVDLVVGPDAGLGRLKDASAAWHGTTSKISGTLAAMRKSATSSMPPTDNPLVLPGGTVEWLTTAAALIGEGSVLSHCVGSYAEGVLEHRSFVASIRAEDGTRATLEMGRMGDLGVPPVYQFRAFRNQAPSPACERILLELEKALANRSVRWADPMERDMRPSTTFPFETDPDVVLSLYDPVLPNNLRGIGLSGWLAALASSESQDRPLGAAGTAPSKEEAP